MKYIHMKIYIIAFFALFVGNIVVAGTGNNNKDRGNTKVISGKVIDKLSGEEIVGAEIKIDNQVIYTDLNGNFLASINSAKTDAIVTFVSYNDIKVNIESFSYASIVIELESK